MLRFTRSYRIATAIAVAIVFFVATLWALDLLTPTVEPQQAVLAPTSPLPPATRPTMIVAPVAIAIPALRQAMEDAAPRRLSGKPDNPIAKVLSRAEVGYTLERSPLTFTGRADGLIIAADLSGTVRVTGQLPAQLNSLIAAVTGEQGQQGRKDAAKDGRPIDLHADLKGRIAVTSRPKITTGWRLEANLVGKTDLAEANLLVAGMKFNAAREIKFLVDGAMSDQMLALAARVRDDLSIENAARREWTKLCRRFPLEFDGGRRPAALAGSRPIRALASQPRIDAGNVTITLGVQAETRIVPQQTSPTCPFPAKLELVPPMDQGKIAIGVPIDVPFAELSTLIDAQLSNKTFPEDGSGAAQITVLRSVAAAAGDRVIVSMLVKAKKRTSWFGFGSEATIHISGKPALDDNQQSLRLDDIALTIEFGRGLRPAGRRGQSRNPVAADGAGAPCRLRSPAGARQCTQEHRQGAGGFPQAGRRHQDRRADHRPSPGGRRVQLADRAGDRRDRRRRARCGDAVAGEDGRRALTRGTIGLH